MSAPPLQAQQSIASAIASQTERLAALSAAEPVDANTPPATLEDALRTMFRSADVVFTGEITEIKRSGGAVLVRWRVEDAVRGAQAAGHYDLREWPGLWEGNGARYVVGERSLVMLHAPSVAGLASPVAGGDGIIPMRGDTPNSVLDLRLLAQHVAVKDAGRLCPMQALKSAGGSLTLSDALQARAAALPLRPTPLQRVPEDSSANTVGIGQGGAEGTAARPSTGSDSAVDGSMVLGMLHAWQRAKALAR